MIKIDTTHEERVQQWSRFTSIYFPRWAWEKAVRHQPHKYSMYLPVYQGCKVIFT